MLKAIQIKPMLFLPIAWVAVLLFCGCQKSGNGDANKSVSDTTDEIDFGTFTNSVYHNQYFGLTVPFPTGWTVQDQKQQEQLMNEGGRLMYGDDKNSQAVLKVAQLQTVHLFAVFQYAMGSPVPFNPSIISIAENVKDLPGIKRGSDYLYQVKKGLDAGQIEITYPTNNYSTKLEGVDFDVMETQMTLRGVTVIQKYYVTVDKGYALSFIMSYNTDAEEASLQKVMNAITFK